MQMTVRTLIDELEKLPEEEKEQVLYVWFKGQPDDGPVLTDDIAMRILLMGPAEKQFRDFIRGRVRPPVG